MSPALEQALGEAEKTLAKRTRGMGTVGIDLDPSTVLVTPNGKVVIRFCDLTDALRKAFQ